MIIRAGSRYLSESAAAAALALGNASEDTPLRFQWNHRSKAKAVSEEVAVPERDMCVMDWGRRLDTIGLRVRNW